MAADRVEIIGGTLEAELTANDQPVTDAAPLPVKVVSGGSGNGSIADGTDPNVKAKVATVAPGASDPGVVTRIAGQVTQNQLDATNDAVNMARIAGVVPPMDAVHGMAFKRTPVGSQGNAWTAIAVAAAGVSNPLDAQYVREVSTFGNTSGASTLTFQVSQDGTTYYDTATTIAANGNFHGSISTACRYVRLKSSAAVTITAGLVGKG